MLSGPKWIFEENQAQPGFDRVVACLNSLNEGLLVVDDEGRIELANSMAMSLLNRNRLAGQPLNQAMPLVDSTGQPADVFGLVRSGGVGFNSAKYSLIGTGGHSIKLFLSSGPVRSHKTIASGGFVILLQKATP